MTHVFPSMYITTALLTLLTLRTFPPSLYLSDCRYSRDSTGMHDVSQEDMGLLQAVEEQLLVGSSMYIIIYTCTYMYVYTQYVYAGLF